MNTLKYLGPVATRVMKLRQLSVPIAAGSEPEVVDVEDRSVPSEVYGDSLDLFPMVERYCESPLAPAGQCEFNAVALDPHRCVWCGKRDQ